MMHEIHIKDLQDLDRAAGEFLEAVGDRKLIAFSVSSPTFAIVNEYRTGSGEPMYHFDFYRIERLEEAYDIGLYDYLDSGCLCLMEWPENIEDLLPEETLKVHIRVNPDNSRTKSISGSIRTIPVPFPGKIKDSSGLPATAPDR